MINPAERATIYDYAYIPEHLPDYVSAISRTESYLIGDFVAHLRANQLVFVGYPLHGEWDNAHFLDSLEQAKARFDPTVVSIIAPEFPPELDDDSPPAADDYYRLALAGLKIPKKTRNMVRRAQREIIVSLGKFGREHKRLVKAFIRGAQFDKRKRLIFQRVSEYAKCKNAQVYDARDFHGELVAFDIADFGSRDYAFYMFNFRASKHNIPGVSDLLLAKIIERAHGECKLYLNLGLGINPGVAFFKKKWGAVPFLKHTTRVQEFAEQTSWLDALDHMAR